MRNNKYELRYLPIFYEDLGHVITYIATELNNARAAQRLLDAVETAILERLPFAECFEQQYQSHRERKYPYYRIYVGNYVVYYVVIKENDEKNVMEVRRFLYKGRNREQIL